MLAKAVFEVYLFKIFLDLLDIVKVEQQVRAPLRQALRYRQHQNSHHRRQNMTQLKAQWKKNVDAFLKIRKKYLLY